MTEKVETKNRGEMVRNHLPPIFERPSILSREGTSGALRRTGVCENGNRKGTGPMKEQNGTHRPDTARPLFSGVVPVISVANIAESLSYYTDHLGFEIAWKWSAAGEEFGEIEKPDFACVRRGDAVFFLDHGIQGKPGSWYSLFLESLEELEAIHHEYRQSGARITEEPSDRSWGMREMLVEDPDGNVFRIGAGVEEE